MATNPIAAFPASRFRRARQSAATRALIRENALSVGDLIWPVFVCDGQNIEQPVASMPGVVRRSVDKVVEAAKALGIKKRIILFKIEIPLALPSIMTGVNQTIMMALAMVVIASMIGVSGLGVPILRSISNQFLALGLMNGLAIVALAIIFDRISQNYARRIQKHKEAKK